MDRRDVSPEEGVTMVAETVGDGGGEEDDDGVSEPVAVTVGVDEVEGLGDPGISLEVVAETDGGAVCVPVTVAD